ncbi:MAG: beta-ketoacyl synthase chain length factor, partial [Giesbergeria sp.]
MHTLSAYIEGIGLLGPGLADWPAGQAVLGGREPYQPHKTVLPPPALLPAAERRRSCAIVKLTLATGLEA